MENKERKLKLNKQTITNLDEKTLSNLRGGMGQNAFDGSCCGGSYSCKGDELLGVMANDVTGLSVTSCVAE